MCVIQCDEKHPTHYIHNFKRKLSGELNLDNKLNIDKNLPLPTLANKSLQTM